MANTGAPQPAATIEGLNDFLRALKTVDKRFSKELRVAARQVAELVATAVIAKGRGTSRQAALSIQTVRAVNDRVPTIRYGGPTKVSTSRGKRVASGNIIFGADFGQTSGLRQFPGPVQSGRILWPTVRNMRSDIVEKYLDAVDRITREAFPD